MPEVGANNHCKPNMNLILPFQSGRGHQDIAETQTKRIFFTLLPALRTRLEICSFLVSLTVSFKRTETKSDFSE